MTRFLLLAPVLLLSACAGGAPPASAIAPAAASGPVSELPPQALESGACALVLWSRATPPMRLAMALDAPPSVRLVIGGDVQELPRVGMEGEPLSGFAPRQLYEGGGITLAITLEVRAAAPVPGGIAVPAGLEITAPGGWSMILPAAGLIACQG